jgi:hypothetical protein
VKLSHALSTTNRCPRAVLPVEQLIRTCLFERWSDCASLDDDTRHTTAVSSGEAVNTKAVCWDASPCSLVDSQQRFSRTCCPEDGGSRFPPSRWQKHNRPLWSRCKGREGPPLIHSFIQDAGNLHGVTYRKIVAFIFIRRFDPLNPDLFK